MAQLDKDGVLAKDLLTITQFLKRKELQGVSQQTVEHHLGDKPGQLDNLDFVRMGDGDHYRFIVWNERAEAWQPGQYYWGRRKTYRSTLAV